MNGRNKGITILSYLSITTLLFIALFTVYWMISSSFKPATELFTIPPKLFPRSFSFEWYQRIFLSSDIPRYFFNSFIVSFFTMCINIVVATLGAYSLTRFNIKGRKTLLILILFSYVFPPILLML